MSSKIAAVLSGAACALALHMLPAQAQDYEMLWGPRPDYPPAMAYPRGDRGPAFRSRRSERRSYFGQFAKRARPKPVASRTPRRRPRDDDEGGTPSASHVSRSGGGAYRTLCVRSCDGYYWPISYATPKSRFRDDEKLCRASCPNQSVALYTHRTEGEASDDAVSLKGKPMAKLRNAFVYRQEYRPECTCKMPPPLMASNRGLKRRAKASGGSPAAGPERRDRNDQAAAARNADTARNTDAVRNTDADPGATGSVARNGEPNRNAVPAKEPAAAEKPDPARRVRVVGPRFLVDH